MKQPLIAAIHGYALGSGTEIALFCDMRIASDDAVFGLPEVSLGMIPAAGGSQTLPRILGRGRALQLLLCCDRVDAQEALRIGLVNKVVKRAELLPTAYRIADDIRPCNRIAVRCAKEAVKRGLDLPLDEGLALERRLAESVSLLNKMYPN
jgi:enoyl-CoA hydratase